MGLHLELDRVQRTLLVYHRIGPRDYLVEMLDADQACEHATAAAEAAKELMALKPTPAALAEAGERR